MLNDDRFLLVYTRVNGRRRFLFIIAWTVGGYARV